MPVASNSAPACGKSKLDTALGAHDAHAAVQVTACYYQDLIATYANPDRRAGNVEASVTTTPRTGHYKRYSR